MKLALIGNLFDGRFDLSRLAAVLADRGHDVEVITASAPSCPSAAGGFDVVPIFGEGAVPQEPEMIGPTISEIGRFLADRWQRATPDIVHCHGWTYGMAALLAARRTHIPIVQSYHGLADTAAQSASTPASDSRRNIEALLAKSATVVTTSCTDDMLEVIRMGCPRPRASVLPPGIDIDEAGVVEMRPTSAGARQQVVSLTEDFSSRSSVDRVITALRSLPTAELVMVSMTGADPTDLRRLHGVAERLGISSRIRVVTSGAGPELSAHLRSADVVVCPTAHDPHATLALRGMAAGTAVVAVESGGARDAVVADVTGVLVPPGSTEALGRAVRSLLGQAVLRQGMGLAGRARVRSRYCWDRIATDAEVVYQSARQRSGSALTH
ncbi:glycosyltransferase family 4 protein [Mycobacterium sp. SMC-4]|uniref:glycosyltransferase family 4 protein n=1 Tax=Mycobacterium sp. SMC-4 TaxID=2857059 RepID=UPI003D041E3A